MNKVHNHHFTNFFKKLDLSSKKYLYWAVINPEQSYLKYTIWWVFDMYTSPWDYHQIQENKHIYEYPNSAPL